VQVLYEAQKALPITKQTKGSKVQQALAWIGMLYQIERAISTLPPDVRLNIDNNGVENANWPFSVGRKNW